MAIFIALKRPGPPAREVLVNLDQVLMVQAGQGSGSAILFGREHSVSFEEDVPTVIRRIQSGPYIRFDGHDVSDQNPRTLTLRPCDPPRRSTIRSPPLQAELP